MLHCNMKAFAGCGHAYIAGSKEDITMSRFSNYFSVVSDRFKAARFNQVLSQMSDRQLADIGVTRETIPQAARRMARDV